jgi:hypothetical protein
LRCTCWYNQQDAVLVDQMPRSYIQQQQQQHQQQQRFDQEFKDISLENLKVRREKEAL